jgi:hypothetical protein
MITLVILTCFRSLSQLGNSSCSWPADLLNPLNLKNELYEQELNKQMSYLFFSVLWQFHVVYRTITFPDTDGASVALGSILAFVGLSRGHSKREKESLGIHRPNVPISSSCPRICPCMAAPMLFLVTGAAG